MVPNVKETEACDCTNPACTRHDWDAHQPTDDMVNMHATIPHHLDDHFSKVEDMAGTGECDALGG